MGVVGCPCPAVTHREIAVHSETAAPGSALIAEVGDIETENDALSDRARGGDLGGAGVADLCGRGRSGNASRPVARHKPIANGIGPNRLDDTNGWSDQ